MNELQNESHNELQHGSQSNLDTLPIIRPTLPTLGEIEDLVRPSWESGIVTVGPTVRLSLNLLC